MNITGSTRVFVIVGDPVAQVRAPEVFNHLFRRHDIDAVLVPMHVRPAALPALLAQLARVGNVGGVWATIPHKAALAGLVDRADAAAALAGAVNAVRFNADGSTDGALFDGIGFVKGIDHAGVALEGRRVLLVGAGGGGQAIAAALLSRGPARLDIHNRSAPRAEALVARLQPHAGRTALGRALNADPAGYDVVINCTSQGLRADDPLPFDAARLAPDATVVDIIMSRTPTPLIAACRARGIRAEAGFEMLAQQAPEYLRFFGYVQQAEALQDNLSEVRALLQP